MLLISNVVASNYAQSSRSQCHSDYFEIFYLIIQLLKIGFYHFNRYFGTDTDLSLKHPSLIRVNALLSLHNIPSNTTQRRSVNKHNHSHQGQFSVIPQPNKGGY